MQSQESESPGRIGTQGCCVEGGGTSAASKQHAARSTQGNRRLSFDLGAWELVGRPGPCVCVWNGGAGANAGTNSSRLVILGGGGGRGEAGSREQGAWARAGLVHRRGGAGPGLELGTGTGFWTCGDYPDNGKVPVVPTPPALYMQYVTGASPGTDRDSQYRSIPDSPWRLVTLTMSRLRQQRQRQQQAAGRRGRSSFFLPWSRLYTVMSAFQRRPGSGVMPMLVGDGVLGWARGGEGEE